MLQTRGSVGTLRHLDGHAEDAAVGSDEGKEDTQRLIEAGADLLQYNLHHLHEGSDDEDEDDGLQVGEVHGMAFRREDVGARSQEINLQQVGDEGGDHQHEGHGSGHAGCSLYLLAHAQEGTDAKEL